MADNLKLEIVNYLNKHNQIYVEITDDKSMEIIHNLLLKDIFPDPIPDDDILYLYIGAYYRNKGMIVKSAEFWQKSAAKGNTIAKNNLRNCYYYDSAIYPHKDIIIYPLNLNDVKNQGTNKLEIKEI